MVGDGEGHPVDRLHPGEGEVDVLHLDEWSLTTPSRFMKDFAQEPISHDSQRFFRR